MKKKMQYGLSLLLALVLCISFGAVLMMYASPMEDVSLDLSLSVDDTLEALDPEDYDNKGWTVYTQDGEVVTELTPDGFVGYTGLELGQTFYYSRVMEEELDSPHLQIGAVNRTFSVWLDDTLIYTDCPELDNRIGYLTLPMNEWDRDDPITISLPIDYQGKTLTIAQSFPEYTEAASVRAYPADIMLYCGYAYESELISESFGTAIIAAAAFAVGLILLVAFVRTQDYGLACLALVAFLWMVTKLTGASFFFKYFGTYHNSLLTITRLISYAALLVFLAARGGKYRTILWGVIGVYALSVAAYTAILLFFPDLDAVSFVFNLITALPDWFAFTGLVTVLVLGSAFWRKESWFYRIFAPLALTGVAVSWIVIVLFIEKGIAGSQILLTLSSGEITYILYRTMPAIMIAVLATAIMEALKTELGHRTEKRLLEERRKLAQESYENMRRQHEEVMLLRHDMVRHFTALHEMSGDEKVKSYLDDLIGQNKKIRPVVETENEMLNIILNSKLNAAADAGIKVEVIRAAAPEKLPLSDADLCSMVMNIMDNAVTAASGINEAFIRLDIHVKSDYLAIVCENSADINQIEQNYKKETVPKHGLGLKIVQGIADRHNGLIETEYSEDCYTVKIAIPLY